MQSTLYLRIDFSLQAIFLIPFPVLHPFSPFPLKTWRLKQSCEGKSIDLFHHCKFIPTNVLFDHPTIRFAPPHPPTFIVSRTNQMCRKFSPHISSPITVPNERVKGILLNKTFLHSALNSDISRLHRFRCSSCTPTFSLCWFYDPTTARARWFGLAK